MERFVVIPSMQRGNFNRALHTSVDELKRRRGTFGHDIVDWLKRQFSSRDIRFSLNIEHDISDKYRRQFLNSRPAQSVDRSQPQADVEIVSFPATNVLLVSGPPSLGALLNYGKRKRNHKVIRLPQRVVSAVRSKPLPDTGGPGSWHLNTEHGVRAPVDRAGHGAGVWLGFVDTGVFAEHVEFSGRTIEFGRISNDGLRSESGGIVSDPDGHGTHMLATAAGSRCGIAPSANLAMVACPLDLNSATAAQVALQVISGIEFLLNVPRGDGTVGVDIINLSLGLPGYFSMFRPILQSARVDKDFLVIAAIGNRGPHTHDSPGDHSGVLSVGALDSGGVPWPKSSHARFGRRPGKLVPRYLAPGVGVWSAYTGGPESYVPLTGTSVASAVATGVAAASLSARRREVPNFPISSWSFSSKSIRMNGDRFHKIQC
jgi:hypothetical protein